MHPKRRTCDKSLPFKALCELAPDMMVRQAEEADIDRIGVCVAAAGGVSPAEDKIWSASPPVDGSVGHAAWSGFD